MQPISHGQRIGNELLTFVPESARIRPLRDQIVVEPLKWNPSGVIDVITHMKPLRGKVRAVGPGHYPKRYDGPKGKRTKSWDSKAFLPCDVQVGDIVELGGLEIGGYLHTTVMWGLTEVVICREADVAIVCESEASGSGHARASAA